MKKIAVFMSAVLLLGMLAVPVAAADATVLTTTAFSKQVSYAATDTGTTGIGVAICFTLNATGITQKSNYDADLSKAKLTYKDTACSITKLGAVVTNTYRIARDNNKMVRSAAVSSANVADVTVNKLYRATSSSAMFAARVINIPMGHEGSKIYIRPYVEVVYKNEKITLYGTTAIASYASVLDEENVQGPSYGTDIDGQKRLFVGDVSVLNDTMYIEIQDELDDFMTLPDPVNKTKYSPKDYLNSMDYIQYECLDKNGKTLTTGDKWFGYIVLPAMSMANASEVFAITLPEGTVKVRLVKSRIVYWTEWEK